MGVGGGAAEGANWDARKKRKRERNGGRKNGVRSVTQIQPAAVLQWKHQGGSRTDTEMTRRAQSPSCQKRRLMCTDNFILAPPAAPHPHTHPYILYIYGCVCVLLPVLLPASHLLSVCTESALSSLASASRLFQL